MWQWTTSFEWPDTRSRTRIVVSPCRRRDFRRFNHLKGQRFEADRTGQSSEACQLAAEERRAHANVGFTRHELGMDDDPQ
jgi:hypothetical protein